MDIVERLRLFAKDTPTAIIADNAVRRADEIERLREALELVVVYHEGFTLTIEEVVEAARDALKEKE